MSHNKEKSNWLDIRDYANRCPDSTILAKLGKLATQNSKTYYKGWWDDLCLENNSGDLPADATVAAYFSVMHPVREEYNEEIGPEQTRRLTKGQHVVGDHWGKYSKLIGGTLTKNAVAIVEDNRPQINLGLQFSDRKDTVDIFPAYDLLIGDQEICDGYSEFILNSNTKRLSKYGEISIESLQVAALMQEFNLVKGNPSFEAESNLLVEKASYRINPKTMPETLRANTYFDEDHYKKEERIIKKRLEILPSLHILAKEQTEDIIKQLMTAYMYHNFTEELALNLAEIRSPFKLDSLTNNEQQLWFHKALVEIYETRHENNLTD